MNQQKIADELAIRNHYAAYTYAVDDHDVATWIDLFTPDARIDMSTFRIGQQLMQADNTFVNAEGWVVGAANIRTMLSLMPPESKTLHITCNLVVEKIEGDHAEARAAFAVFAEDGVMEHYGRYRDKLKKCSDGRWRFTERRDMARYERDREVFGLERS